MVVSPCLFWGKSQRVQHESLFSITGLRTAFIWSNSIATMQFLPGVSVMMISGVKSRCEAPLRGRERRKARKGLKL
jgi:hypothetical protein